MTRIGIRRPHARGRRRSLGTWAATLGVVAVALIFASPAFGWSQIYRHAGNVPPGGIAYSGNNYNLHWNEVFFEPNGWGDVMQLTLCNTVPQCYQYSEWHTSFGDPRSISYGHAKCTAKQYNYYPLYVYHCFTHNE